MTRFIHDQFAKDYLETLLSTIGKVESPKRVAGEARQIDVAFVPSSAEGDRCAVADRAALGLLGKMATTAAIFEPFRNPVTDNEIRDCLLKLLELDGQLRREAKRNKKALSDRDLPRLWIWTPTASDTITSEFGARDRGDWGEGIHFLANGLRTAIVAIHRLPQTPETLWLRLLGRGTVQKQAIEEFLALPETFEYRATVLELFYTLERYLTNTQGSAEDRELVMRLEPLYRQERDRAIQQGAEQKQEQIALNMLRAEVNVNRVANFTELSLDRIIELQQQVENENSEN